MPEDQIKYVSGEFEGYFYTNQKMPLSEGEKLPGGRAHEVYVYRGELRNYKSLSEYKPEEHLNRNGLLLHNVTNVQLSNGSGTEKKVYDFDQLVLKDVKVEQSWELEGKTYGILKGTLVGKIKKHAVTGTGNSTNIIPPPPPKDPGRKWWDPAPNNTGNPDPGASSGWGTRNRGCLSRIWDILKWILLILLLLLLYKSCFNKRNTDNFCCEEYEIVRKQNDSLLALIDSLNKNIRKNDSIQNVILEESKIQEEINDVSERIYFYGNSDNIREYSENTIKDLIEILNRYPNLNLEIQGHTNGTNPQYSGLDLRRAERVKKLLIESGVESGRLTTIGLGGDYPIVSEQSRETDPWGNEYNQNMRVEIVIRK